MKSLIALQSLTSAYFISRPKDKDLLTRSKVLSLYHTHSLTHTHTLSLLFLSHLFLFYSLLLSSLALSLQVLKDAEALDVSGHPIWQMSRTSALPTPLFLRDDTLHCGMGWGSATWDVCPLILPKIQHR